MISPKLRGLTLRVPPKLADQLRQQWQAMRELKVNDETTVHEELINALINLTVRWQDKIEEAVEEYCKDKREKGDGHEANH